MGNSEMINYHTLENKLDIMLLSPLTNIVNLTLED